MSNPLTLINWAIDNLKGTEAERELIRAWVKDNPHQPYVHSPETAHDLVEALSVWARDAAAEEAAAAKWREVSPTGGKGELCQAPGCVELWAWEIETMIEQWVFIVRACDKHAGKEETED